MHYKKISLFISLFVSTTLIQPSELIDAIINYNESRALELIADPTTKLNATNDDGDTPLYLAVKLSKDNLVLKLLQKNAQINPQRTANYRKRNRFQETPLHLAVFCNNHQMIEWFFNFDANFDIQNSAGNTPLMHAVINAIRAEYMDEDTSQDTFARMAKRDHRTISLVLTHHPNLFIQNTDGKTVFNYPANSQIISTLKEAKELARKERLTAMSLIHEKKRNVALITTVLTLLNVDNYPDEKV